MVVGYCSLVGRQNVAQDIRAPYAGLADNLLDSCNVLFSRRDGSAQAIVGVVPEAFFLSSLSAVECAHPWMQWVMQMTAGHNAVRRAHRVLTRASTEPTGRFVSGREVMRLF